MSRKAVLHALSAAVTALDAIAMKAMDPKKAGQEAARVRLKDLGNKVLVMGSRGIGNLRPTAEELEAFSEAGGADEAAFTKAYVDLMENVADGLAEMES